MLRRRFDSNATRFIQPRERALRLQIEMLLSTDVQLTLNAMWAVRKVTFGVATHNAHWRGVEASCGDRIFNGEDRGQKLVVRLYASCAEPRVLECFAQYPCHGLCVVD